MLKVNMGGCGSFVNDAEIKEYTQKAVEALKVLAREPETTFSAGSTCRLRLRSRS